ncbi:histidine kinase [Spirosoma sp. SC4-14]|uniref:sensor histidine kinase n=1 Tax=Spirosoma sp. SC4-14 TaxID=3128900 RepID=UPI0030D1E4E3
MTSWPAQHTPPPEQSNSNWVRWIFIPFAVLLANLVFLKETQYNAQMYIVWSLVGIVYGWIIWRVNRQWMLYVRRRYAYIKQTRLRVITTFAGYTVITGSLQAALIWLGHLTHLNNAPVTEQAYRKLIIVNLIWVVIVGTIYEVVYYLHKYRQALQEAEALKKAGLQRQYDRLKSQVNPHFLFNCLNSLSALIAEDRQRASAFLDELASVYRYMLQASQRPIVTLSDETAFLSAFCYLLDTRFGKTLRWQVWVDPSLLEYWLPPLTLQLLIENALRHNLLLVDQPLTICINTTSDGHLEVSNRIQRKKLKVPTQLGGLALLATRFDSLDLPRPVIEDDGHQFVVRVPLAKTQQSESNTTVTNRVE